MPRAACPAVRKLDSLLRANFPLLNGSFKDVNGKMSQRLQTGGNPRHQLGVCLDILLFSMAWKLDPSVDTKREKALAENLVKAFVDFKSDMKWTEIILQDRLFWEPEYYKPYKQDTAHFTHIHIDWMTNSLKGKGKSESEIIAASPQTDHDAFGAGLVGRLAGLKGPFDAGTLAGVDLATILKRYSPDLDLTGEWRVAAGGGRWTWIYTFNADGTVTWRDPGTGQGGNGKWQIASKVTRFTWANSTTTETWNAPTTLNERTGTTNMKGTVYDIAAVRL